MKFRYLKASDIDARIGTVKEEGGKVQGVSILLYKDARCDMNILDETFGQFGWQRSHDVIDGNLYCTVSIYDEKTSQWISKQDVGTESKTEAEKGQASDSFKRACFNWGIGRELYTAPFIWITGDKLKSKYDKFEVTYIDYTDGKISALEIFDKSTNKTVFTFGRINTEEKISAPKLAIIKAKYTGKNLEHLLQMQGIEKLEDMTEAKATELIAKLNKESN